MRYLIISDLHSNDEAFMAVLRRVKRKKFDRVICLGDFVGYAADPNKVLDRYRTFRRPTFAIRGNHDKVVAGVEEGALFNPPALEAARWTTERLSRENADFLKKLAPGPSVVDGRFVVCHGSPLDEDAYIFSDFDASLNFVQMHRLRRGPEPLLLRPQPHSVDLHAGAGRHPGGGRARPAVQAAARSRRSATS